MGRCRQTGHKALATRCRVLTLHRLERLPPPLERRGAHRLIRLEGAADGREARGDRREERCGRAGRARARATAQPRGPRRRGAKGGAGRRRGGPRGAPTTEALHAGFGAARGLRRAPCESRSSWCLGCFSCAWYASKYARSSASISSCVSLAGAACAALKLACLPCIHSTSAFACAGGAAGAAGAAGRASVHDAARPGRQGPGAAAARRACAA